MKAAIQGRTKCAKILLFAGTDLIIFPKIFRILVGTVLRTPIAVGSGWWSFLISLIGIANVQLVINGVIFQGASPTVRDYGRGLRAEEWARFCGRYGCAEMIERHSRSKLMEKGVSSGRWGSDPSLGPQVCRTGLRSDEVEARIRNPADTRSRDSETKPCRHAVTRLLKACQRRLKRAMSNRRLELDRRFAGSWQDRAETRIRNRAKARIQKSSVTRSRGSDTEPDRHA
ncbi:unnamed protein product, partial [Nesidiocoris tenuis]